MALCGLKALADLSSETRYLFLFTYTLSCMRATKVLASLRNNSACAGPSVYAQLSSGSKCLFAGIADVSPTPSGSFWWLYALGDGTGVIAC